MNQWIIKIIIIPSNSDVNYTVSKKFKFNSDKNNKKMNSKTIFNPKSLNNFILQFNVIFKNLFFYLWILHTFYLWFISMTNMKALKKSNEKKQYINKTYNILRRIDI